MRSRSCLGALLLTIVAIAACSGGDDEPESASTTSAPTTTTTRATSRPTTTTTAVPTYETEVRPVSADDLPVSWRPGCPVGPESLRLIDLDYWGYDGVEHRGQLVVHADHEAAMVEAFRILFDARFPIERMELVDAYGGDDAASTHANNTSAFNCRDAVGNPGVWSQHAYGAAIDINPLVNPFVRGTIVDPVFLDRSVETPGLIRPDDVAVQAFASIGWTWGGYWASPDYQHFSASGS